MKTSPILIITPKNTHDIMFHEYMIRDAQKINKNLLIRTPKTAQEPLKLISEEENEKILEKLKSINKKIFGI